MSAETLKRMQEVKERHEEKIVIRFDPGMAVPEYRSVTRITGIS